jgi:hypothetical protein
LEQNKGTAFQGDVPRGSGFLIDKTEYIHLSQADAKNKECMLNYIVGMDINHNPEHTSNRYAICFYDWKYEDAKKYPELLNILEERVKPARQKVKQKQERNKWWLFARYRKELREAIKGKKSVLVRSLVSENHMLAFVPSDQVLSCKLVIFSVDDFYNFAVLQSRVHEVWLRRYATTLRTDISYTISNCYETFPFPQQPLKEYKKRVAALGKTYYEYRRNLLIGRGQGLTPTYNMINDPLCDDSDIESLRDLQSELDKAVISCYGWGNIDLNHSFYPNERKNVRFMPHTDAQREIFIRLMKLNQQIAAAEAEETNGNNE